jgi:hypothetical protein
LQEQLTTKSADCLDGFLSDASGDVEYRPVPGFEGMTVAEIARSLGLAHGTTWGVAHGVSWKHVLDDVPATEDASEIGGGA